MGIPHTELTDEHKSYLLDLFTTALEGGIGYWSECSKYHWRHAVVGGEAEDINGFVAVIYPPEQEGGWGMFDTEDTRPLKIDLEVMHRGARLMNWYVQGLVDGHGKQIPLDDITPWPAKHYYWQFVESYVTLGQSGDYDAGVADMVVQFGLFGEVVYG
jgi:hypothetical protein